VRVINYVNGCQMDAISFSFAKAESDALIKQAKWLVGRKSTPDAQKTLINRILSNKQEGFLKNVIHMYPCRISPKPSRFIESPFPPAWMLENLDSLEFSWSKDTKESEADTILQIVRESSCKMQRIAIHGINYPPQLIEIIRHLNPSILEIYAENDCLTEKDMKEWFLLLIKAAPAVKTVRILISNWQKIFEFLRDYYRYEVNFQLNMELVNYL
jgi:hypothetical protein